MTDKQRITEILKAYTKKHNISASSVILEEYAEELLANGVIVPPVEIGNMIYKISILGEIVELKVSGFSNMVKTEPFNLLSFNKLGKTVFVTKEEAEEKLKELER